MRSFIYTANLWGADFVGLAWSMLWQSSLVFAIVFAVDFILGRKMRASVRYALWLAALLKLLLPPSIALPTAAMTWMFPANARLESSEFMERRILTALTFVPFEGESETGVSYPNSVRTLNGAGWVLIFAASVSTGLVLVLVVRWRRIRHTLLGASFSDQYDPLIQEAINRVDVRFPVSVRFVDMGMSPAAYGLLRPVILIPRNIAHKLSNRQLLSVLVHEFLHLRRRDSWVSCAQTLLQIVYWWHPILWLVNARIRRLREEVVDDNVMFILGEESDVYVSALLEAGKLAAPHLRSPQGFIGVSESYRSLRQRIERLMDFRVPSTVGLTPIGVLGIGIFTAATLLMAEGIRSQASVTRAAIQDLQNRWKSAQDNLQKEFALNAFAESPILTKESTNPTLTSALPILLEASQDADRHVSLRAIGLLHDIQYGDRRSVLELGRWVRCGTNLSAANLAAKALKEMRSAAIPAIPDLIKSLENRRDDGSLIHGGRGADGSVTEDDSGETIGDPRLGTALRRATIEALGNLGPAAIDAVPVLRGLLSDRRHFSLGSRVFSAKALWQITGQTNATLPVLVEALRDENSFLAADILGSMGSEATLAIPALVDAIERGHSDTQIRARFALRRITTPSSH
jgi:beta-lactamase regulating signal transducer with metallopeptidase domain